jgi:hypothetical protein
VEAPFKGLSPTDGPTPLFYPAKPPAHWLMVSEVPGRVLVVPLAPANSGDARKCRPIGCFEASPAMANRYREDR